MKARKRAPPTPQAKVKPAKHPKSGMQQYLVLSLLMVIHLDHVHPEPKPNARRDVKKYRPQPIESDVSSNKGTHFDGDETMMQSKSVICLSTFMVYLQIAL